MADGGEVIPIGTLLDEDWMTTEPQLHSLGYDGSTKTGRALRR